ncbi:MAG: YifB family Mg chelatase-like AAA ATPase [Lachnospiraceae bacterium]|nr:YifB family Mg chelatase-like AAA ATPase [Lachnospiraceae bacterium]
MYYSVKSGTIDGMKGAVVNVEVDASNGMPYFSMVGYLSHEVREAKERVIAALRTVGFTLPPKRITVSLSPADLKKAGASFDFPIAIAVLGSFQFFPTKQLENAFLAGELGLEGSLRAAKGLLPMLLEAKNQGITTCYIPVENVSEVGSITGMDIYPVETLSQMVDYLRGIETLEKLEHQTYTPGERPDYPDFADIKGQSLAKRALEIAAAGRHNILFIGPAGCGKTLLAHSLMSIIPPLTEKENQEVASIYSARGEPRKNHGYPPLRAPHHTISYSAFLGGGNQLKAGEITLAHKGVLLIDEMPEFRRNCLEGLREPMQNHHIAISRTNGTFEFPADAMIVATANPCPCGNYPDMNKCHCTEIDRKRYVGKITKPLIERFDMIINVGKVCEQDFDEPVEKSEQIYKRIINRRNTGKSAANGRISSSEIENACKMNAETKRFSIRLMHLREFSMREYHNMLRVAKTIADLDGQEEVQIKHISEAAQLYDTSAFGQGG